MKKMTRRTFLKGAVIAGVSLTCGGLFHKPIRRIVDVLAALTPRAPQPLPASEHARVMSAAHSDDLDGMSVLYLAGTHYEMGYQHGTLMREKIHAFRQAAYTYMTSLLQKESKWPDWLARLATQPLLGWQAAAYWDIIPPEYLEEAQGIADGAGVHPLEVVLVTAIWEMYIASGCSEFALTGRMTADGSLIHGFNYDLMSSEHAFINPYLAMIFYRPASGIPFSTLNTVGSIGVNAGMNDAGLSVAWDNTDTRDNSLYAGIAKPVVPFIITLRRVLECCRSLDEGVQLVVASLPRPLADIIILASANENRAVALETAGRLHATRPMENDAVWSTNRFRSAELAPHDRRGDWRRMNAEEYARVFPRYLSYERFFQHHRGQITPRLALDVLRDPYPREAQGELYSVELRTTICREGTSFSLVMQPGQGLVWGSDGKLPAPQGRFFAFDQRNWQRRPDLDFPSTGFRAALACAKAYGHADIDGAWTSLQEALVADGETAPLLMMRATLSYARGDTSGAQADVKRVIGRWGETDIGQVVRAWAIGQPANVPSIPFPSAIARWLIFHAASADSAYHPASGQVIDLR